jgi:hypothetical protein
VGVTSGPVCGFEIVTPTDFFGPGTLTLPQGEGGAEYFVHPDGALGRRYPDGREQKAFTRTCDGAGTFVWVDTGITTQDLIDDVIDRARRAAPLPEPDISPPPAAGGIVNLGLWLAVTDVAPAPIRVQAGLVWAQATLAVTDTVWEMGDGTTVTCPGVGVPIEAVVPDLDTVEQGPCGHTYKRSSPDDAPYAMSVTANWAISYTSNAGSGTGGTITRTTTIAYDVDEIQTIGEAG